MKRALVLSGGGAKGAYQIGVAKALKRLNINYDIVTGTSVGSLNGLLLVQKDLRKAIKLWKKMNFNFVFDKEVLDKFNNAKSTLDMLAMFSINSFKGGMSVNNLEKAIRKNINIKRFFHSKIDFGLSTYNLTQNVAVKIKKINLNENNIIDYVLASSSCFPAIKMKKINDDNYVDGGIFDYIPINLAIELGATEIIAVDLKAPGIKEKIKNKNIPITYIEPKNELSNFLDFSTKNAKSNIKYGYFDTLKYYNKLDGNIYTFKKNDLHKNHNKYYDKLLNNLNTVFDFEENKTTFNEIIRLAAFKRISSIKKDDSNKLIDDIIDNLGNIYNVDTTKCYRIKKFNKVLLNSLYNSIELEDKKIEDYSKLKIIDIVNKKSIIKFFYMNVDTKDYKRKNYISKLALSFPKEFISALYLYTITKGLI